MLTKNLAFISLLGAFATGNAQTISFHRTYSVGQTDTYNFTVERTGGQQMTMSMTETLTVTKLLDDGGAEVSVTIGNMKMNNGGREISIPAAAYASMNMVEDYNAQGFPYSIKSSAAATGLMNGSMFSGTTLFAKGLTVGQDVPYDYVTKTTPPYHSKGTVTLVSVTGGLATIHVVSDGDNGKSAPVHVDMTYTFDTSAGKIKSMDMKSSSTGGPATSTHMTMTLQ